MCRRFPLSSCSTPDAPGAPGESRRRESKRQCASFPNSFKMPHIEGPLQIPLFTLPSRVEARDGEDPGRAGVPIPIIAVFRFLAINLLSTVYEVASVDFGFRRRSEMHRGASKIRRGGTPNSGRISHVTFCRAAGQLDEIGLLLT